MGISPKVNIIAWLEFELASYDVAVQHVSHHAGRRPLLNKIWNLLFTKLCLFWFTFFCCFFCFLVTFITKLSLIPKRTGSNLRINSYLLRTFCPQLGRIKALSLYGSRWALSEDSSFNSYPSRPEVCLVKNMVR